MNKTILNLIRMAVVSTTAILPTHFANGASFLVGNVTVLDSHINTLQYMRPGNAVSALYRKRLLTLLPLIRDGANVNITLPETKGNTALHYACGIGNYELVEWLLQNGADPVAVTHKGATPYKCAGGPRARDIRNLISSYQSRPVVASNVAQVQSPQSTRYEEVTASSEVSPASWVNTIMQAAERGVVNAQFSLGKCYLFGEGVEKDEREAVTWFRRAANQGLAAAQSRLGECYYFGKGVEKNEREAVTWFRMAAEQGHAAAQSALGYCYCYGEGIEKDEREAVTWFRMAAEQGHDGAQCLLGRCYLFGEGVEKDAREAVTWFRKAAERGVVNAQYYLGYCYYHGEGIEKDAREAVSWFRKAAEQGHAGAQFFLGYCYYHGEGIEKDEREAVTWIYKAAAQGEKRAIAFAFDITYSSDEKDKGSDENEKDEGR